MKITATICVKYALAAGVAAGVAMSGLTVAAEDNPADWPLYYRDSYGWRYSPLDQITPANVGDLRVAWIHQPGDIQMGLQATPIVIGGVIYYVGPNNNVFAVNGKTCNAIWHYRPELHPMTQRIFLP